MNRRSIWSLTVYCL